MSRVVPLSCDRPFTCPRCAAKFEPGMTIALVITNDGKHKVRYCEDCACQIVMKTTGASETVSMAALAEIEKRLTALENKPSHSSVDTSKYVEVKTYSDKQTSIWRELETLNQKLNKLDARLLNLE